MKILIIDDEKPTLSMFKLFLAAYGYDVYTAEDGEKGLAVFHEIAPEIVFTDIKMPGIDGLEVLRRIRETKISSQVIIITGHGDMEKAMEALDLDASDFINKPVERQALNSALARAEKRRELPQHQLFDLVKRKKNYQLKVSAKGKLTESARDLFMMLLSDKETKDLKEVRLLLDDSFSIDRPGISILMEVIQGFRQRKILISIENISYNYARVFQMAGIDKIAVLKEAVIEG